MDLLALQRRLLTDLSPFPSIRPLIEDEILLGRVSHLAEQCVCTHPVLWGLDLGAGDIEQQIRERDIRTEQREEDATEQREILKANGVNNKRHSDYAARKERNDAYLQARRQQRGERLKKGERDTETKGQPLTPEQRRALLNSPHYGPDAVDHQVIYAQGRLLDESLREQHREQTGSLQDVRGYLQEVQAEATIGVPVPDAYIPTLAKAALLVGLTEASLKNRGGRPKALVSDTMIVFLGDVLSRIANPLLVIAQFHGDLYRLLDLPPIELDTLHGLVRVRHTLFKKDQHAYQALLHTSRNGWRQTAEDFRLPCRTCDPPEEIIVSINDSPTPRTA